uniref:GUN4-like domain-containing protein n=1 Tax=Coccolithus braarudii TaxID=221442 RepID=A0A7S0Q4D9_9EUKA
MCSSPLIAMLCIPLLALSYTLAPHAGVLRGVGSSASPAVACAMLVQVEQEPLVESTCGFDFVPLRTALQAGDFLEADQLTRDGLIKLAGESAVKRGYVYFAEIPRLPEADLASIERLWRAYSKDKFGYSVQSKIFNSKKVNCKFEDFFDRIGWTNDQGKLLRWLPDKGNEFIYDLDKAPDGHLPLTSALRGTQLLEGLLAHPAMQREEFD